MFIICYRERTRARHGVNDRPYTKRTSDEVSTAFTLVFLQLLTTASTPLGLDETTARGGLPMAEYDRCRNGSRGINASYSLNHQQIKRRKNKTMQA